MVYIKISESAVEEIFYNVLGLMVSDFCECGSFNRSDMPAIRREIVAEWLCTGELPEGVK